MPGKTRARIVPLTNTRILRRKANASHVLVEVPLMGRLNRDGTPTVKARKHNSVAVVVVTAPAPAPAPAAPAPAPAPAPVLAPVPTAAAATACCSCSCSCSCCFCSSCCCCCCSCSCSCSCCCCSFCVLGAVSCDFVCFGWDYYNLHGAKNQFCCQLKFNILFLV